MYYYIVYVGHFFCLINLILFFKDIFNRGKTYKIFAGYLGAIFCIQMISWFFAYLNIKNLFLSHFYFIGQFLLLGLFYYGLVVGKRQKNIVKYSIIISLMALVIQYAFYPSQFHKFNLFEIALTSLTLILFAVLHLYNMLTKEKVFYYITLGIIFYLLGSTILFFVGNLTALLNPKLSLLTWTLNAWLYIIYNLFILFEWKKSFSKNAIQE
jgi:hypothetical protein